MKNHKIIIVIVIMAINVLIMGTLKSQTAQDSIRMQYDSLDTKYFPSGILYNRSPNFLFAYKFDTISYQWQINEDYASSPYIYSNGNDSFTNTVFNVLYEDMLYCSNDNTILTQRYQYNINDSIAKTTYDFPISLMDVNFHTLDPNAIKKGEITYDIINNVYTIMPDTFWINDTIFSLIQNPDSLAYEAFDERNLYAATATRSVAYKKFTKISLGDSKYNMKLNVSYNLPKSLFIQNTGESTPTVKIDFDDGNGFVNVAWNSSSNIEYSEILTISDGVLLPSYSKAYKKTIKVIYPHLLDAPMLFDINIVGMNAMADTVIQTSSLQFECTINEPNYSAAEGKVSIRYADENVHKLTKPIIVVEGFESATQPYGIINYKGVASGRIYNSDGELDYEWTSELRLLFDSLHNHGYDIIYVDHKDPRTWIQKNALSVIKVIQYANKQLQINNSNEKLIVMGASMGGLIVRYALRKMEMDGCCHNTRLYATFDSPHQGANISVGIQHFVKEAEPETFNKVIDSYAARQMLVYHIESSAASYRNNWQNLLDSMGHPQNCRQIALINGSEIGTPLVLNSADKLLLQLKIPLLMPFLFSPYTDPVSNWLIAVRKSHYMNYEAYSEDKSTIFSGNNPSRSVLNHQYSYLTYYLSGYLQTQTDLLIPPFTPPNILIKLGIKTGAGIAFGGFYNKSEQLSTYSNTSYPLLYTTSPGGQSNTPEGIREGIQKKFGDMLDFFGSSGAGLTKAFFDAPNNNSSFIPSVSALDMQTTSIFQNIKSNYLADQNITEFDSYWATLRGDKRLGNLQGNEDFPNQMHVEVDQYNRAWLQEHILADWELRNNNGEYNGVLTGYYNYGRPWVYEDNISTNKPYQTILYSLDIEANGILYVNKQDKIGLSTGTLLPQVGSAFKLKTNCDACDTTLVRIKDKGKFIIGDHHNSGLNKAEVSFDKSSILEILSGGELYINEGSKLIIEEGATLIIHQGAKIILDGVLEIKGKIKLKNDASLSPTGNGFIRFAANMNSSNYNDYWEIGTDASIRLTNTSSIHKEAEVVSDLYLPDDLLFELNKAKVEIADMKNIHIYASVSSINSEFTAIDSNNFYNSVSVYGQQNVDIESTKFTYGNYGLKALMNYGGNSMSISNCIFTRNYIGLYTSDQYIFIKDCELNNNIDYGWKAESMQANCDVTTSQFNNNGMAGISFLGQSKTILNINKSQLIGNNQNGIEITGASLGAKCSKFNNNSAAGIYSGIKSKVRIAKGSKNQIRNNNIGIVLNKTELLELADGYNNFSGNQYYIVGELSANNYYSQPSYIASMDIINNLMPAGSVNFLPINIYLINPITNNIEQLTIINWTNIPSFYTVCINDISPPNINNYKMFEGIISISVINSNHYTNTYLADALKSSAMQMSYGKEYQGNDTLAISMFKSIFNNIPPNINEDEHKAIGEALGLMMTALTNAIEKKLIDPNKAMDGMPVDEYVAMIEEEIQHRLNDLEYSDLYYAEQKAYFELLKAQLYRAAEHYDYALAILQNDNYFFNTTLKNEADYWNCVCNAENKLLKGYIERSQYEQQIDSCHEISTARLGLFMPILGESKINKKENENQILGIYPNPAEQLIAVEFTQRVEEVVVELSDQSGRLIWTTTKVVNGKQLRLKLPELSCGTYILKTITETQVFNNKIIIR